VSGALVVVATPIGNLGDVTRRALEVLAEADVIYCEDTRHTRQLLSAHEIPARGRLVALHEHNEASLCEEIVSRVAAGQTAALVTDAGTPGVSDPGERVVAAVAAAGLRVTTAPGVSAAIAALSVSGLSMDRFVMEGFLPRRAGERAERIESWRQEPRTTVLYESPQRLVATLGELAGHLGDRRASVVRELTKFHEEVVRGTLTELAEVFSAREVRGEVVVVLEGAASAPPSGDEVVRQALAEEFAAGASTRDAASSVAATFGVAHRRVYELALELRRSDEG
jgi:16S rRNA (cytidine1402-2'-O)-methyltransferase